MQSTTVDSCLPSFTSALLIFSMAATWLTAINLSGNTTSMGPRGRSPSSLSTTGNNIQGNDLPAAVLSRQITLPVFLTSLTNTSN